MWPPVALDDCLAKLERAKENIANLDREVKVFFDNNPHIIREQEDVQTGQKFPNVLVPKPPLRFSVLAGEIIHHLRSSLDYLVWRLAIANGECPTTRNEFPIFKEVPTDETRWIAKINGISPSAQAIIEGLQPHKRWNPPSDDPLWILHDMDIEEKHHALMLLFGVFQTPDGMLDSVAAAAVMTAPFPIGLMRTGPLKNGAELFGVQLVVGEDKKPMLVHFKLEPSIVFDQFGGARNVPIIPALQKLWDVTYDTIRQFEGEFVWAFAHFLAFSTVMGQFGLQLT